MLRLRLLPWEYGIRNLFRRPARTGLTLVGLTTVVLLVFVVVAFIRGLEASLAVSGDPKVVLVYSIGAAEDVENSAIAARIPALLSASLEGIERRYGLSYISPELYVATRIAVDEGRPMMALLRGVTPATPLVRRQVQMTDGKWPGPGEILAGRLAATKLGCRPESLAIGRTVRLDGRPYRVSGHFAAGGAAFESELWFPLANLQQALKRQDLSLVAMRLGSGASAADVELFCKERVDLELQAIAETKYYALLQSHYRPVRMLGWVVVVLVAGAGVFAGLNTMYGAVVGRVKELSTLQAIGFRRRSIALSLIQEASLLAAAGSLLAALLAVVLVHGTAVRFTMGAFALRVDSVSVLVGCGTGFLLGLLGAIPPAVKAMRISVIQGMKAV
ncbi:MAG: ABC transporter permease [Pirellulaceae bacterium]